MVQSEDLPNRADFAFLYPLYSKVETDNSAFLSSIKAYHFHNFDMHCVGCGREATFGVKTRPVGAASIEMARAEGAWVLEAFCTRASHSYTAYFVRIGKVVIKVGQYPSVADIQGADIRKYRAVLREGYFPELVRAVGLASHGIGIGAFVYLRRIFEKLLWDHDRDRAAVHGEIEGFSALRIEDKIEALTDVLPASLVENKAAYSILSKGLHELTEEECKLYFPVVKAAILNILEEDLQVRERAAAAKRVRDEVAKIAGELRKGKDP
jgi:hypothetical protein